MRAIDEFEGVEIGLVGGQKKQFVDLIGKAVSLVQDVRRLDYEHHEWPHVAIATTMAIQSLNSLLSAGSAKCHLASPPEDIDVKMNKAGDLVYRCYHSPAHEWDLNGHRLP